MTNNVTIVGAGNVGTATAFALLPRGLTSEIVLIDIDQAKCKSEARELSHTEAFTPFTRIRPGDFADCAHAAIVVLTAGQSQKRGQSQLGLLQNNASIFREIIPEVVRHAPNAILLIATNPVDPLTYAAWKLSGLSAHQVIGSGTVLDSALFCDLLGQHFGINPQSVHAYIIGEHGDSEVPVWSLANIAGIHLRAFCEHEAIAWDEAKLETVFCEARNAAYEKSEGRTEYGIASGLVRIIEAILRNENSILTVTSVVEHYGIPRVALSLPTRVNRKGAEHVLHLPLSEPELAGLVRSAEIIRSEIKAANLDSVDREKGNQSAASLSA